MTIHQFFSAIIQAANIRISVFWYHLRTRKYMKPIILFVVITVGGVSLYQAASILSTYKYLYFEEALNKTMKDLGLRWEEGTLNTRLALIKREMDISSDTIKELKNLIYENSLRTNDLKEQVYFYQSVVAPEDLEKGLSVFDISVSKPFEDGHYPIEVILRKAQKSNRLVNGHIKVSMYGKDTQDEAVSYASKELKFSFRYFQRVRGILNIPNDFQPEQVVINVFAGRKQSFEQHYAWLDIADPDIVLPLGS